MEAFTFAKNEAYSLDVAFHTRKGCRANVQTRDAETGWCFKNGGQPLFGYRAERFQRGEVKRGRPLVKIIWVPDETIIAGCPMREWARHCLVELAGNGASLEQLRAFCEKTGIPGRRKQYWGISTWHALLQPSVLMQYCGYAVWNVHTKARRERPANEWVIVERAHQALITEEEAKRIAEARQSLGGKKQFNAGANRSRTSRYLLSGGLFRCGRCGANMIGFHTDGRFYYVCGSQPYRSGMGCGPGVYVPQARVESEVLSGLRGVLDLCADPQRFMRAVNKELRQIWEASTGFRPDAGEQIAAIDRKVENIRRAVEEGLNDANWANTRLRELHAERGAGSGLPKRVARPSLTPRLRWTTAVRPTNCFGRVAKLSGSNSCEAGWGSEADAPGLGGQHQLSPARGHYEWIGCGGLHCTERADSAVSCGVGPRGGMRGELQASRQYPALFQALTAKMALARATAFASSNSAPKLGIVLD